MSKKYVMVSAVAAAGLWGLVALLLDHFVVAAACVLVMLTVVSALTVLLLAKARAEAATRHRQVKKLLEASSAAHKEDQAKVVGELGNVQARVRRLQGTTGDTGKDLARRVGWLAGRLSDQTHLLRESFREQQEQVSQLQEDAATAAAAHDAHMSRVEETLIIRADDLARRAGNLAGRITAVRGLVEEQGANLANRVGTLSGQITNSQKVLEEIGRSGFAEQQHATAVTNQRLAAWNDALRNVMEDVERDVASLRLQMLEELDGHVTELRDAFRFLRRDVDESVAHLSKQTVERAESVTSTVIAQIHELPDTLRGQMQEVSAISSEAAALRTAETEARLLKETSDQSVAVRRVLRQRLDELAAALREQLDEVSAAQAARFDSTFSNGLGRLGETMDRASSVVDIVQKDVAGLGVSAAELQSAMSQGFAAVKEQQFKETTKLNIAMYTETQQTEALLALQEKIQPRWLLPSLGRWALDARAMLHLHQIIEDRRPRTIVELGSGTSTIWLGYLAEKLGARLISFEHEEEFLGRTDAYVAKHQLTDVVRTVLAPLELQELHGNTYKWYSSPELQKMSDVDLLLVDGPVGTVNKWARYPALPVLWSALSADATILLDDSTRLEETEVVEKWLAEFPVELIDSGVSRLSVMSRVDKLSADADM